ncbi:TetR/AcrR family transcriptional regulator [Modestobacter sp. VKM Ac-2977]|uniref:TetR/AcrR family transcriptional regulator n=1 Tax=Modestobacter sp. VKM Ac-2977 TaxID=3004131 RepID=UPI0022AAC627|nr:TetR/AcrR family transcriptional regulator [Modestobacter sp. VKM Ac-2977]MCZ2820731.1 TetR/AcrR family transcriptional regulator [Modestobacter sp. VKM Ac-2977]
METSHRSDEARGGRDAVRTRRSLLDAAAAVLAEDATATSLATIAARAGVTKGALTHHFASRDALFEALADDSVERFRRRVRDRVDLSENRPGKLLRAYVNVLCDDVESPLGAGDAHDEYWSISLALHGTPAVERIFAEDAEWWTDNLRADGLEPDRVTLVSLAVDGLAALAVVNPGHARAMAPRVRAQLLELVDGGVGESARG